MRARFITICFISALVLLGLTWRSAAFDSTHCKEIETGLFGGIFGGNRCDTGSIHIDPNLAAIGDRAFAGGSILSVYLGEDDENNKLKVIGRRAFYNNKLTAVEIPDTVTAIAQEAFGANKITSVKLSASVAVIEPFSFNDNKLQSIFIPESVVTIKKDAFSYNELTEVVIPDTVTNLESSAFMHNKIKHVVIPSHLTTLRDSVFAENEIENIIIPNSVTHIEAHAFMNNKLVTIRFPGSVKYVGSRAFAGNPVRSVCYDGTKAPFLESDVGFDVKMLKKCTDTPCRLSKTFAEILSEDDHVSLEKILTNNDIDCTDKNQLTLLMQAAFDDKFYVVEGLLNKGANPNVATKLGGQTALMAAVAPNPILQDRRRQSDIVRLLLKYNADKKAKDSEGDSACSYLQNSDDESLRTILGCNVDERRGDQLVRYEL